MNVSPSKPATPCCSKSSVKAAYPVFDAFQLTINEELSERIAALALALMFLSSMKRSSRIAFRMPVLNSVLELKAASSPVPGNRSSSP